LIYILPLFWKLDGVWNAQPVSDGLSFVITGILLLREMRKLKKMEDSSPRNRQATS
jgi:Na+-driven multidrug efflux pump